MKVLLQYVSMGEPPVGVWWANEEDEPECFYVVDSPARALALDALSQKLPDVPLDDWFDMLAARSVRTVFYETVDTAENPRVFFQSVKARES